MKLILPACWNKFPDTCGALGCTGAGESGLTGAAGCTGAEAAGCTGAGGWRTLSGIPWKYYIYKMSFKKFKYNVR